MNMDAPFLDEVVDWMGTISPTDRKSEYVRLFRMHPHFCDTSVVTDFLEEHLYPSLLDQISIPPGEDDVFLLRALPSLIPHILARIDNEEHNLAIRMQAVGFLLEARHPDREKYLQQYASHGHPLIRTAAQEALDRYVELDHASKGSPKEWLYIPCSQKWNDMEWSTDPDQRHCNRCSHTVTRMMSLATLENAKGCVWFDPADHSEHKSVQSVYQCTDDKDNEKTKPVKEDEERIIPRPPGVIRPRFPDPVEPPPEPKSVEKTSKKNFWSWIRNLLK